MALSWSSGILNVLVSPDFTSFNIAIIPTVKEGYPQAPHWLANFFLNSALRGKYEASMQQLVLGFLRRAYHGFIAYHSAREATLEYLDNNDPHQANIREYYEAIALWENYVLQIAMAIDLYNSINLSEKAFIKNDSSKEQRIYSIANNIKHVGSCVKSGQCTEQDTLPLWLTNDGLSSFDVKISFNEASEILIDVATLANLLQDPQGLQEGN
jgi:hypothetical protein